MPKNQKSKKSKFQRKTVEYSKNLKLPNVFVITKQCIEIIYKNNKVFMVSTFLYFILSLVFVRGLSATINVLQVKNNYIGNGGTGGLASNITALGYIFGTSFSGGSASSSVYQSLLYVIFSLVFIWLLRELYKNNKVTIRDSFYKSQYPFIPFIIVMFYIVIELIPAIIGLLLYETVSTNGIASNPIEKIAWILVLLIFIFITAFLITSTIFAIYIVTLPNMRPFQAIKASWKLVKKRRLLIFRKLIFLPIFLFLSISIINVIFIALIPQIADYVYFALSAIALVVFHSYIYSLYRDLI